MRIALTFDTEFPARPTVAGAEDRLLASLAAADVLGTFFLQGRWVRANPDAPMDGLDDELLRRDVRKAEETIREIVGVDPKPWFRCPFGAGMEDERVLGALAEVGYRHVGWDVDPEDWNEAHDAEDVARFVLDGVRARKEDTIVLLHGWPAATAEALPRILDGLGDELVTVDALIES